MPQEVEGLLTPHDILGIVVAVVLIGFFGLGRRLATACAHTLEEIGDGHVEDLGHVVKSAGTDSIGATLVLLDLLEGDPEPFSQLFLTETEENAPGPRLRADVKVDWICSAWMFFSRHRKYPLSVVTYHRALIVMPRYAHVAEAHT